MVINMLPDYWRKRELEAGRIITVREVAEAADLNWETVSKLKRGETSRFDGKVLAKLCKHFGVEPGQPVPFIVYSLVEE